MSFNYGARRHARVKSAIKFTTIVCILFSCFMWALLLAFPRFFIHMFNSEPELLAEGVPAMHLYFFGIFMMSLQFAGQSTFTALGKAKQAVFFSLLRKAIIVIPLTLWLPTVGGLGSKWSLSCRAGFQLHRRNPPLCHDDLYRMEKAG